MSMNSLRSLFCAALLGGVESVGGKGPRPTRRVIYASNRLRHESCQVLLLALLVSLVMTKD